MLKFSEATNLAIHALAYLYSLQPDKYATAQSVAEKLHCSPSHLAKVLNGLAAKGVLDSSRGAKGGFRLRVRRDEITTLEIVEAVDGPLQAVGCLLGQPMCHQDSCVFQDLFVEIRERVVERLREVRLVDIPIHS